MTSSDIQRLILEVRDAIMVLNQRGVVVTPSQADERARNIVNGLIGNYDMRPLPGPYTVDFADPRISPPPGAYSKQSDLQPLYEQGKPVGHGEPCRCDPCDTYNRSVRR